MSDIEALSKRMEAVEGRTTRLENTSAPLSMVAMIDRDVAECRQSRRGQMAVLNSLRVTQIEHGRTLTELKTQVAGLDERVSGLDERVAGLDERVAGLEGAVGRHTEVLAGHTEMLAGLDERVGQNTEMLSALDEMVEQRTDALAGKLDLVLRHLGIE